MVITLFIVPEKTLVYILLTRMCVHLLSELRSELSVFHAAFILNISIGFPADCVNFKKQLHCATPRRFCNWRALQQRLPEIESVLEYSWVHINPFPSWLSFSTFDNFKFTGLGCLLWFYAHWEAREPGNDLLNTELRFEVISSTEVFLNEDQKPQGLETSWVMQ